MDWIETGKIVGTHGIKGEVKIEPWCDSPDFLLPFKQLQIGGQDYTVETARVHKSLVLVKLTGIDDPQAAQALRDKTVYIDRTGVDLPRGRYFVRDLIGLSVMDQNGERVGTLYEVLTMPAHDVYRVQGEDGEHYIPAIPQFIRRIDMETGIIHVELIEGM